MHSNSATWLLYPQITGLDCNRWLLLEVVGCLLFATGFVTTREEKKTWIQSCFGEV